MSARLLLLPLGLVLLYWGALYVGQRGLMYPAPPVALAPARPLDAQPVWLVSAAGRTEAWFLPPLGAATVPAPLLVFAHGNGELIHHWPAEFLAPRGWGVGVLLVEYPGYGNSGGAPSRATIQQAFEAAFDWATTVPAVDPARIIGYGRSLGGGAVGGLSRTRPLAALVLESTFTNTTAFAWGMGAPPFLVRDRFDNLGAVAGFRGPILVLHGDRDRVIPVTHGERLAAAAGTALYRLPCGHNDCARPWDLVHGFLAAHGLLPDSAGRT